jgi:hypothetical protein
MSVAVKYDPDLFSFERAETLSSKLGSFLIGLSRLGAGTSTGWVPIQMASFTMTSSYSVEDKILIVDADTASVSMSYWAPSGTWDDEYPLYSGDRVRALYDGVQIFLGTVDSIAIGYEATPSAQRHGRQRLITFSATMLGTYASMMGRIICPGVLPAETAIVRIRRWLTVNNW